LFDVSLLVIMALDFNDTINFCGVLRLKKIIAKAFAKVNPWLDVLGKYEDGYHELDISFLSVNLADRMTFESCESEDIVVSTEADIPAEENLCREVASKLKKECSTDLGAVITLEKEIPIGGGLGGGSSNAAATLICLNRLWDCKLSRLELIDLGEEFGADVPFFFYGGFCIATGRGTELRKQENVFLDRFIPLILPPFTLLTREVYGRYDQLNDETENRQTEIDHGLYPLRNDSTVENDLQEAALDLKPNLEPYLNLLQRASTIDASGVAGSGSSIFGISRKDVSIQEIKEELESELREISKEADLIVTRPTNHGQLIREVE